MSKRAVLILLSLMFAGCHSTGPAIAGRHYVEPRLASDGSALPFSGAVRIGDTLYLSGHIGIDENRQVPNSAEAEAVAVLDSFRSTLTSAGMEMDDLVYVQVFCSDPSLYDVFNRTYRSYFTREFPARAFIGSGPLLFGARFEVQGIAVERARD
ncbi:MAG: RidA family protein [Thermoanaerobaculia bacterium]|nr:RidA family protein [Thermoanaerobaculia bacterium]